VIGGGVGGGVTGAEDSRQRLACLGQVAEQRVKAEAALVGAGAAFLLGVGDQQRGVDVEDQLLGSGSGVPGPGQRHRAGGADRFQEVAVDRLQHPVGGALGGHRPEQGLLAAQDAEVCDVVAAIGDRDREIAQDDAGVMGASALPARRHRLREAGGEPEPIGQLDQEIGAGVGDEPLAVRPDFYGLRRRLCLHLPGVLLGRCEYVGKPHSQDPRGRSRRVSSDRYRWIEVSAQNGGDRRGWFHFPFAPPETTKSRPRARFRSKRLKGFEPSTFCMAITPVFEGRGARISRIAGVS
jgi:hypothetical protein